MNRIAPLLLLGALLVGCGRAGAGASLPTPTPTASGTSGPFHAVASPARLAAGETVHLTLTVTGPLQYQAACVQTLQIWAEDSGHQQVWRQPQPMIACMAIAYRTLAAGETATFKADWPTSPSMAPGSYSIHGYFMVVLPAGYGTRVRENLPPLTIQISG